MTLPLTPIDWRPRITRWKADCDKQKPSYELRVRGYAGPGYYNESVADGEEGQEYDPINHTFNAISTWLPNLVYGTPRVKVGTSRSNGVREAEALELALNRVAEQSGERQLNEMLAVDYWIGPLGVCLTTNEPRPGFSEFEDPPYWPTDTRIPPFDFVYDTQEINWKRWRYMGHRVVMDLDNAIAASEDDPDLGWDRAVLDDIAAGIVEAETSNASGDRENRNEFEYYEVYCPEVRADDLRELGYDLDDTDSEGRKYEPSGGYHGAIFYILLSGDGERFVRDPAMFWGPRGGPYTIFPGYFVPNEGLPLSPDAATVAQAEGANTAARAILRSADRGKHVALVASSMTDLEETLNSSLDGDVHTVTDATADNLKNRVVDFRVGGVYPELLAAGQYTADMLDRASGFDDQQRGRVDSSATATASAIASRASSTKLGFLELKFREGVAEKARKRAWYLWHEERAEVDLGAENGYKVYRGGSDSAILRRSPELHREFEAAAGMEIDEVIAAMERREAGEREMRKQDPFDAQDFSIEPYSMARTQEGAQQIQLQNLITSVTTVCQIATQYPFVEIDDLTRQVGDMANTPNLERIINMDKLGAWQKLVMGQQFSEPEGQGQGQEPPRLARDAGRPAMSLTAQGPQGGSGMGTMGASMKPPENAMAGKNTGATFGAMNQQGAA